ncbi:GntR family transcriptional regulator [Streptomyces sp. TR06-5]|uniref:GntR family transcriptional regulator n=1 Tax=unclassified Streptomyces TaxID=2593676 RepID=UPI00399F91A1
MQQVRTGAAAETLRLPRPGTGGTPSSGVPPHGGPQRHSVRAQVLADLRRALLSGDLAPGRVYSAPALAERHGVSATPVREAMQQLASEGLVETVPNRGFRVVEHSARDAEELAEVRLLLELPVVLRLCRTRPPATWEAVRPLADRTVAAAEAGDRVEYAEADRAFHRALLEPSGNCRLTDLAEDVQRRAAGAQPAAGSRRTAGLVPAAAEHVALLDALCARDAVTAERVLRDHLVPGGRPGAGSR